MNIMRKSFILAALVLIPFVAGAQTVAPPTSNLSTVSITANGVDVKGVLHDMFTQAKKSYVVQPNTHFSLNLVLDNVDFDEALSIVCQTAELHCDIQNGIYFISRGLAKKQAAQQIVQAPEPVKPKRLPESVLNKKIITRMARASLISVFATLGAQTDVLIEVDKSVPAYKMDAFLINTSLRYALEQVTKAASLQFEFTDHNTIRIFKATPVDPNRVSLTTN